MFNDPDCEKYNKNKPQTLINAMASLPQATTSGEAWLIKFYQWPQLIEVFFSSNVVVPSLENYVPPLNGSVLAAVWEG